MLTSSGARERPPRFLVAIPAKVTVVDQAAPGRHRVFTAVTANVSDGGMAIDLPDALPPWTPVSVQVETGEATLEIEAVVLWHEEGTKRRGGAGIRHGLLLSQISPVARPGWDGLLRGLGHVRPSTREHTRFPFEARVVCQVLGRRGPPLTGRTENISRGGLGLLLPERLAVRTGLEIEVLTRREPVRMGGRVIWSSPIPVGRENPLYPHGVTREAGDWPHDFVLDLYLREAQWKRGRD